MEEYLGRCLDSLTSAKGVDSLDIVVVNDGSKDNSLAIANDYKSKFSQSIVVVDKPNGNYGSTINAALPIVKGKYVKILDADDWFDTNALDTFVDKLKNVDVDMILTDFTLRYATGEKANRTFGYLAIDKICDLSVLVNNFYKCKGFGMHALTYRASILVDNNYRQTEGISYTDQEWIFYPMLYVNTFVYFDINLYQYFMGRPGQTMSPEVIVKSMHHSGVILERMISSRVLEDNQGLAQNDFMRLLFCKYLSHTIHLQKLKTIPDWVYAIEKQIVSGDYDYTNKLVEDYTVGQIIKWKPLKYFIKHKRKHPVFIKYFILVQLYIERKVI